MMLKAGKWQEVLAAAGGEHGGDRVPTRESEATAPGEGGTGGMGRGDPGGDLDVPPGPPLH